MTHRSPAATIHESLEAFFLTYGPPEAPSELVETFGELDMEYAAIRKACVLFDMPHAATLEIRGDERIPFLENMLTAKLSALTPNTSTNSFWLNRQGRIDADLRITQLPDRMLVRLDRHLAQSVAQSLEQYVFAEDVTIAVTDLHTLSIHGPNAHAALNTLADDDLVPLEPNTATETTLAGVPAVIDRDDLTAETGYTVAVPPDRAAELTEKLHALAEDQAVKLRPAGWLAINTARIEAGRPLFNIDFGPDSLPAETSLMDDRVNLTKGCYLGQEVVARMHARGVRKQGIAAIKLDTQRVTMDNQDIAQPVSGAQVFDPEHEGETPVGAVTSSTVSPMLGAIPIAFAVLKDKHTKPGTTLSVWAEGAYLPCVVQETLTFWAPARASP